MMTEERIEALKRKGGLQEDDVANFERASKLTSFVKKVAAASADIMESRLSTRAGVRYEPHIDWTDKQATLEHFRQFVPGHRAGCNLGVHKDAAWQIKTPQRQQPPRSRQVKFDSWEDSRQALFECLHFAWFTVEPELDDAIPCPYDLKKECGL